MGVAEIVPGTSGGTIAFISGIYERLVNSLQRFTPSLILRLRKEGIKGVWVYTDATFLLILFVGMAVSIIVFANSIGYLLYNEPVALWSFFFGMVMASCWVVSKDISRTQFQSYIFLIVGVLIGLVVTHIAPLEISPTPAALFFGGMFAVCAWILPGLSGSFILLIFGLYAFVVEAIKSFDVVSLVTLGAGCVIGLVSFSQVLSVLFSRYRNGTLAVLTGFMMGSLAKLWPWKNTLSYHLKSDGTQIPIIQEPVLPQTYELIMNEQANLMLAVGVALSGIVLVVLLDWVATRSENPKGS
jgi:putative membrane protein